MGFILADDPEKAALFLGGQGPFDKNLEPVTRGEFSRFSWVDYGVIGGSKTESW